MGNVTTSMVGRDSAGITADIDHIKYQMRGGIRASLLSRRAENVENRRRREKLTGFGLGNENKTSLVENRMILLDYSGYGRSVKYDEVSQLEQPNNYKILANNRSAGKHEDRSNVR
jgi:hypothetical protein